MQKQIPRLVIAATQSGAGKTTMTTGLLAALAARGCRVQSFKVGPDYIDPGYHQLATGRPGQNLDTWLTPRAALPSAFAGAMAGADLAVIEGVMGLYDGGRQGISSTAEIAKLLRSPVLLVIDAKSMGASAAALALGFREYDREVQLAGVLLNRVGSATHEAMLREAMAEIGLPVYGAMGRDAQLQLPERHLGLTPAAENSERDAARKAVAAMSRAVTQQVDIEKLLHLARQAEPLEVEEDDARGLEGEPVCSIAVARDEAFSFYYPASLQVLERCGARLVYFSPLHDSLLPEADGLLLGGGFPEMFAARLEQNVSMRKSVRQAAESGMPVYAECGGYMYLLEALQDFAGVRHEMTGVLPGRAVMTSKLQTVGYIEAIQQRDTVLGREGLILHGHEFHFSTEQEAAEGARPLRFRRLRNDECYLAGQCSGNVLASYLHIHFAGCPEAARHFVEACRKWRQN